MAEAPTKQTSDAPDPQQDVLLEHNYDGIQEYDNPMPRWWVLLFWGTFLFAVGYFFHYQLSPNGRGIYAQYAAEMKVAAAQAEKRALAEKVTEQSLEALTKQEPMVLAGKAVFQQRCVTCHNDQGQGKIGPNLTDKYALHGGTLMDIYKVVHDGVIEKGMQAWGKTLKPLELRQVVAFVGTLRGTNVPGKAPQGEPFELGSGEAGKVATPKGAAAAGAASAAAGPKRERSEEPDRATGSDATDAGDRAAPAPSAGGGAATEERKGDTGSEQ